MLIPIFKYFIDQKYIHFGFVPNEDFANKALLNPLIIDTFVDIYSFHLGATEALFILCGSTKALVFAPKDYKVFPLITSIPDTHLIFRCEFDNACTFNYREKPTKPHLIETLTKIINKIDKVEMYIHK